MEDKTMKKVFGIAALLLALAACNKETEITPVEQPSDSKGITITATLAPKTADTKAVADGGDKITVTWAEHEHIAILYTVGSTKKVADAEITAVDGGGTATITFTVDGGTTNDTPCTLVYPLSAAKDDHTGVKDAATLLSAQDGTLNANLDVRVGAGTIQTTTPSLTVTTQPEAQFAIFKFDVKNADASATIDVKPLIITIGTQDYVITPASATSTLYVALPAVSGQTVSFSATGSDSKTYTCSKDGVTFAAAKYYQSTLKMTEAAAYKLLSAAMAEDIGKVVCAAGHLHTAKTAVPAGCTAVGILGKVTATGIGLILALQDATEQSWNTINGWTSVTSYADTELKVLPDAAAHGANLTSYITLGTTAVSNWAVAQKSDYEAIFTNLGSTKYDDGMTYDANVNAYITTGVGGTAISYRCWSATENGSNTAWGFYSEFWNCVPKGGSSSVRPVLGFGGEAAPTKLLSAATTSDVGKVVCAAGHLHTAKTAVPAGCTAVGILGKVTATGIGLILALQDATEQSWNTINGWTSVTSYADTELKVLPDAAARGANLTSYTALGTTAVSNWAVAQKSGYEAIFTNLGSTKGDKDGKTYDGNVNAYITTGVGGTAISDDYYHYYWSTTEDDWSGQAWTFYPHFWRLGDKTTSNSVRPVLGFGGDAGAVKGQFSVSDTKKVYFSKGNLQYVGTWQFAANQWECFGTNQSDNHRDLFGWGTKDNPNNVSGNDGDYSWAEWGGNTITGGTTGYRTLTSEEWLYLKDHSTRSVAKIEGVYGLVFLPDEWTLPEGCSFTVLNEGYKYDLEHANQYTPAQWALMEANGAVFLPFCGSRSGTKLDMVNEMPFYWTCTPDADTRAREFSYTGQWAIGSVPKSAGLSVRLVKDVE